MKLSTCIIKLFILTTFISVHPNSYADPAAVDTTPEHRTKNQKNNKDICQIGGPYGSEKIPSIKGYIVKIVNEEFQKNNKGLAPISKVKYRDITQVKFSSFSLGEEGFWDIIIDLRTTNNVLFEVKNKFIFVKSNTDKYKACNETTNALLPAILALVKVSLESPEYKKANKSIQQDK
jgi:hypothetical protein